MQVSVIEDLKPLTSLRFFAAAMIVSLHATNYFPWASIGIGYSLEYGVSFFFVLSGFILTHVYQNRKSRFSVFMVQRLARLWPVHITTLSLVVFFIREDSQQLPGEGFFNPIFVLFINLFLVHSIIPFQIYAFSWNSVSWSISTEIFFYIIFLGLLAKLRRYWLAYLLVSFCFVALFDVAIWAFSIPVSGSPTTLTMHFLAYASPVFRGFEFVLGMATYIWWQAMRHWLRHPFVATLVEVAALVSVVMTVLLLRGWSAPVSASLPALGFWLANAGACGAFALLIFACAGPAGWFGKLLSHRPFVWLGEISFALYMVHQPLMKWIYIQELEGKMHPAGPLLVVTGCLGAAAALHHLVERPARSGLLWLARRPAKDKGPSLQ